MNTNHIPRPLLVAVPKCALTVISIVALAITAAAQTNTFPASGNAGVGTTTPDQYANIHISQGPNAGMDIQSSDTAGWARLRFRTSTRIYGWFAGDASQGDAPNKIGLYDYTANAFRMMIDSSGNVGIGATSPTSRLHVGGASDNLFAVVGTGSGASDTVAHFSSAVGTNLIVRSNGYIGIGNVSPSYKLDVAGQIRSSSGGFVFPDGTVQATAATGGGGGSHWSNASGGINYSAGNVAIGTSTPAALLDVRNSDGFFYAGFGYGANKETFLRAGNSTTGVMHIGDLNTSKTLIQEGGGNVGIATNNPTEKLEVYGNLKVSDTGNITAAGTIEAGNIKAKYQDIAEWVPTSEQLPPGTVVVLDITKVNQVVSSTAGYDTRVAGVISEQPGITLGESGEGKVLVATTGRVRVKVDASRGPIRIGDLLVTSDIPGVAMRSVPFEFAGRKMHMPGTIIGKALAPLPKGRGEILVLLSLQ
ncbi:MAG: peptidase G2 autoproteolytic cleavage domain-containing protein [Pyrinomonadaceae bacterium]